VGWLLRIYFGDFHKLTLSIFSEQYPIRGNFTIARGSKTAAAVVICQIEHQGKIGRGECVPYSRYGESVASVLAALESIRPEIDFSQSSFEHIHENLIKFLPAGAARNALDCALWDLRAKLSGRTVAEQLGIDPKALTSAYTISLADPQEMGKQAKAHANLPLLKIKVGSAAPEQDIARMRAVRTNAPDSMIIVDANEGWNENNIEFYLAESARYNIALIEQPLPVAMDGLLGKIEHKVAIYADESIHESADLPRLQSLYDGINIKLDKTGGLSEALRLKQQAREMGFGIMVGCMVATSLAMAPAILLAQGADFVDLDGPLLLSQDRCPGLTYEESRVCPPNPLLWG